MHFHVKEFIWSVLALFYYTLGNIKPDYRSTLENIQLVAVTKSSVLQEYGSDHILKPIMDDIKKLEEVSSNLQQVPNTLGGFGSWQSSN